MTVKEISYKIYNKLRAEFVLKVYEKKNYGAYCKKYASYRHMVKNNSIVSENTQELYMTARPNPGAGIGHQMANWIAGYWFAEYFQLNFAHTQFSSINNPFVANDWDEFLGFGTQEVNAKELLKKGWKKVVLPKFDENRKEEVQIIKNIISSYSGQRIVFYLEQDQFYHDQYGVMDEIQKKFYMVHDRTAENLKYCDEEFNIAVHVRRGDIVQMQGEDNPNLTMRWMDNAYFVNALRYTLSTIQTEKKVHIYLFSQGTKEDYPEFDEFSNVTFCLDMSAKESFLHMVYADALITSKSSFSYKPALLCKGLKICPANFWHGYPKKNDWILLNDKGERNE